MHNPVRPYGERWNDGWVQVSFSVPAKTDDEAVELAKSTADLMNLYSVQIVHHESIAANIYFFVVYGKLAKSDLTKIEKLHEEVVILDKPKIHCEGKIKIIGACIGSDAHSVGLDAILNIKGYKGIKGLEAYKEFEVVNLGSQVENKTIVHKIKEYQPHAVLISQVITHNDLHIRHLKEFTKMLEDNGLKENRLLILGGPRITNNLAVSLGFDKGFGSNTSPANVAEFIMDCFSN